MAAAAVAMAAAAVARAAAARAAVVAARAAAARVEVAVAPARERVADPALVSRAESWKFSSRSRSRVEARNSGCRRGQFKLCVWLD